MEEVTIKLNEREVCRVLNCVYTAYTNLEENKDAWFVKEVAFLREIYRKIDTQMQECLIDNKEKGGNLC